MKADPFVHTPWWEKPALQLQQLSSPTRSCHTHFTGSPASPLRADAHMRSHSPAPQPALSRPGSRPETQGRTRAVHARKHSTVIWFPSRVQTPGQVSRAHSLVPLVSHFLRHTPGVPSPLGKAVQRKTGLQGPDLALGLRPAHTAPLQTSRSRRQLPAQTLAERSRAGVPPSRRRSGVRGSPGRDGGPEVAESPAPGNSPPLPVGAQQGLRAIAQLQPSPFL